MKYMRYVCLFVALFGAFSLGFGFGVDIHGWRFWYDLGHARAIEESTEAYYVFSHVERVLKSSDIKDTLPLTIRYEQQGVDMYGFQYKDRKYPLLTREMFKAIYESEIWFNKEYITGVSHDTSM